MPLPVAEHAWSVHGGGHHVQGKTAGSGTHSCADGACWKSYELLGLLGRGGFGTIHRARSRATGEVFAVKQIARSTVAERELQVP